MDLSYNPYDFANPVSDASLLVGREKEMEEIKYYLDSAKVAPRPSNIALLGPRASGKTSILNITEYESKKRGFWMPYRLLCNSVLLKNASLSTTQETNPA